MKYKYARNALAIKTHFFFFYSLLFQAQDSPEEDSLSKLIPAHSDSSICSLKMDSFDLIFLAVLCILCLPPHKVINSLGKGFVNIFACFHIHIMASKLFLNECGTDVFTSIQSVTYTLKI